MDKNDRFLLIVIFIIMAIFVFSYMFSILDNRQIAIQKDITEIKQMVEQIELNTDPVEIVEEMEVETVFVEIWSNLIEVRVDTVEIFIDTEENKRGPWRERKQGKKEE